MRAWLRATKDIIWPNFDITPEMLTHTGVVDLKTWRLTEAWEQREWVDPPVELLTDYIAAALRVNQNPRPFYFLHMKTSGKEMPDVPLWHADQAKGRAVARVIGCAGDWFGATGYDTSNADLFITGDLRGGRPPAVLEKELPCILVGHWPCFYVNDGPGFKVLKEVKRRLDAFDPDRARTIWMKNSEIGRYWMARTLSDLRPARSRRDFQAGTFLVEGRRTFVAFDLPTGATTVTAWRSA